MLTPGSHDRGIDLFHKQVFRSASTTAVVRTIVQCKLYRGAVSVADIRDFFGVMTAEIAEGYFFTTGQITSAGIQFIANANKSSYANSFRFVDRDRLDQLMGIGVSILELWQEFDDLDVSQHDYATASKSILEKVSTAQH